MSACKLRQGVLGGMYQEFWGWAGDVGVVSKQLRIEGSGPSRGLLAGEAIKNGAVVVNVPFAACLSLQSLPSRLISRAVPSPLAVAKYARRVVGLNPFESSFLWLSTLLATQAVQGDSSAFAPYLRLFPRSVAQISLSAREALRDTSPQQREEYAQLERQCAVSERFVLRLLERKASHVKYTGDLPNLAAVHWAHRTVLSRALVLPSNCAPSAPDDLETFMANNPMTHALPALVPILDMVNCCEEGAEPNLAVYTCRDEEAPETTMQRVVAVARRPIAAGEELTLPYDLSDPIVSLLRYGFMQGDASRSS